MKNQNLIETLQHCAIQCTYCADACLDEDNLQKMIACIRTDRACAAVCNTTAQLLAANYKDVRGLVEYCQTLCNACADECEQHQAQHCQDCAAACRKCAEACQDYLAN
ncbi:four-helix bundle copper-binding protein [Marixanthomonas spongiae]|uniref:Four-helix bundle copper-binding protein n=1 Tax=Marixanthomonas spongiae TaxID=2174845 RepID=A0A2U0I5H3_9FLAO|nr:four-helix bundle copper-binding protein [Marixanthomonas spongiae]PVW16260.1 four-helix bundle copper-binding protein [Marixanthomonas spongiae]